MNLQRINQTEHVLYDSLEELEEYASTNCKRFNPHAYESSIKDTGVHWIGLEGNGQDARQKILNGWPELLEKLRPLMNQLEVTEAIAPHRAMLRRRKMSRGDHGDRLDMHRVYAGELDKAWSLPKKTNLFGVTDRKATLVVNIGVTGNYDFDDTLWRAATALKISDMLQRSGRAVEIYVGASATQIGYPVTESRIYCRVKEFNQPLAIERLAAMCSAAFHRTYGFMARGAIDSKVNYDLGTSGNGLCAQLQERKGAGELVIELARCFTFEDALRDLESVRKQMIGDNA